MHKVRDALRSCFLLQAFMKGTVKTSFLICFDLVVPTRPVQGILINENILMLFIIEVTQLYF